MDTIRELDERIADIVIGPPPAWQTATLENGWVNFGGGWAPATYTKDMVGVVHLRGLVKGTTSASIAFTLPVGFRPGYTTWFSLVGGSFARANLIIRTTGTVEIVYEGSEGKFGLDGITFLGER